MQGKLRVNDLRIHTRCVKLAAMVIAQIPMQSLQPVFEIVFVFVREVRDCAKT